MNGNKDNYNDGAVYPNTSSSINDSANGSQNWYTIFDVQFYTNAYYGGSSLCTNSMSGWKTIGIFNNDKWSSHQLVSTLAC